MGRMFVAVGYGQGEPAQRLSAALGANILAMRDGVLMEARSRGLEAIAVPDDLDEEQAIHWINRRDRGDDLALELSVQTHANATVRGTQVYYIAQNRDRQQQADLVLLALARRVPDLVVQGALPDTQAGLGYLRFCRQVIPPSLYLHLGFVSNDQDLILLQTQQAAIAAGVVDGLVQWQQRLQAGQATLGLELEMRSRLATPIHITVNGRMYGELGVMHQGNPYIPVDLAERLGMTYAAIAHQPRLSHGRVVYLPAIALRSANIAVTWDDQGRSLHLRSILPVHQGRYPLTGRGYTTEVQLLMLLKAANPLGLAYFPDVARLYIEESSGEGMDHDIAFAQMCIETNFLYFGGQTKPDQNNFGGLGTTGGNIEGASFPSRRIGVRAHIQHLKAYANTEPLREEIVDPRFQWVIRGTAPTIADLTGRWSVDPHYGDRVVAVVRQLYEIAGLL